MARSVKVSVAGKQLAIRTDAKTQYVRDLAAFVTAKMEELAGSTRNQTTQSLALLAAMNVADELFQERRENDQFRRRVRDKAAKILARLDQQSDHFMD